MERSAYSPLEMMIVAASRLIADGMVLMVGTQWPIVSALLARKTHAPGAAICFEGGTVLGSAPSRIPLFTGDPVTGSCACMMGDSLDTLGAVLHAGFADLAIISGANVDRFGNINTTCIGDYHRPKQRFGGSGGAGDFGSLARRLVVVVEHNRVRFPERVDYITTPGYLQGRGSREAAGFRAGTGPWAVVTTLGLFRFDENGEMVLAAIYAGGSAEEVRDNVQWDLRVAEDLETLPPPDEETLRLLREEIDPLGIYLRNARATDKPYF
ncbi:MAG: CoA-transferase subunit beta [Deltaproteobacteria bacterium]|nr:CoA-transferase subunit beta [Deltaproteobacteria bacterium]